MTQLENTLPEDKKPETAAQTPTATPEQEKATGKKYEDKHLQELHDHRMEKKGARRLFHLTNFFGLHMAFNSTLSVFLTYNILPTRFAQNAIGWMEHSAIGKAAYKIFSAPAKVIDLALPKSWKVGAEALTEEQKLFEMRQSARSSVESMFMCIAGFVALAPVKWFENSRATFLNWADNLLHPGRTKEEKEAAKIQPHEEPKETWGNLLRARVIGLMAVFTVDRFQQLFNNARMRNKKPTADTYSYKFGTYLYEKMPAGMRSWLTNFFSRKNVTLSSIQGSTRENLLETIKSPEELIKASGELKTLQDKLYQDHIWKDHLARETVKHEIAEMNKKIVEAHPQAVERAVFAEQSRLFFTKELWLTAVVSTVIYACAKAKPIHDFLEKIWPTQDKHQAAPPKEEAPVADAKPTDTNSSEKRWSDRKENRKKPVKAEAPAASFKEAVMQPNPPETSMSIS